MIPSPNRSAMVEISTQTTVKLNGVAVKKALINYLIENVVDDSAPPPKNIDKISVNIKTGHDRSIVEATLTYQPDVEKSGFSKRRITDSPDAVEDVDPGEG